MYPYPKVKDFVFNFAFILEGGQRPPSKINNPTGKNYVFNYVSLP